MRANVINELLSGKKKKRQKKERNLRNQKGGILKFNKQELKQMPLKYKNLFACEDKIVKYRFHNGVYEARYRRDGFNIAVSSK